LKSLSEQNTIIEWIVESGIPEVDFGVVLPADADERTFDSIRAGYTKFRQMIEAKGRVRARYAIFHLIPIALYRGMETKYSVEEFPEGWNFYFPVYDGTHFSLALASWCAIRGQLRKMAKVVLGDFPRGSRLSSFPR
jgi:hypothetical protein